MTVHRDLKPENVLYKNESHHSPIVIADFGIAKHLEYDLPDTTISPSSTISNNSSPRKPLSVEGDGEAHKEEEEPREGGVDSFAGSFGYAAPEVLLGLRHGLKVDCWSIGSVLLLVFLLSLSLLSCDPHGRNSSKKDRMGTSYRNELNNRVIAYTLLCGYSPFRSDDKAALVEETKRGKIVFHERYWRKVSDTGKSERLEQSITGARADV